MEKVQEKEIGQRKYGHFAMRGLRRPPPNKPMDYLLFRQVRL
jgi:hypothetical protein